MLILKKDSFQTMLGNEFFFQNLGMIFKTYKIGRKETNIFSKQKFNFLK